MKSSKNLKNVFFLFLFFISSSRIPSAGADNARQEAVVREVTAGDQVRLAGGKTLRYAGVQAPPLQSLLPLIREYGNNALIFNQNLVSGKKIFIEWDSQIRDSQNNFVGYVFLEDGTFVNEALLKTGHAKRYIVPPNTHYAERFRLVELDARRHKRGLWKEEPENPYLKEEFIGEKSTKVFYFPTSPELDGIPEANLVKFRSRVDATAAGYTPCATCRGPQETDEY
ncbi:MAG: thermonuclease family protein [Candidatus Omnitrophica bacterium]|nr:thermonuclease family protein [Candidatus Omnitrophota bacterium]